MAAEAGAAVPEEAVPDAVGKRQCFLLFEASFGELFFCLRRGKYVIM